MFQTITDRHFFDTLLINVLLGVIWHYASFFLCILKRKEDFSPDKRMYRPHKWERGGRFYSDTLRINKWKDRLPKHTGKNGFSKEHLDTVTIEYIDTFIMETCRGEWNHTLNCMFAVILMIINKPLTGLLLSALLLIGNVPFICIQRYNRFRLQRLKKMLLKKRKLPCSAAEDTIRTEN